MVNEEKVVITMVLSFSWNSSWFRSPLWGDPKYFLVYVYCLVVVSGVLNWTEKSLKIQLPNNFKKKKKSLNFLKHLRHQRKKKTKHRKPQTEEIHCLRRFGFLCIYYKSHHLQDERRILFASHQKDAKKVYLF